MNRILLSYSWMFQDFSLARVFRLFRGLGLRHLVVVDEEFQVKCSNAISFVKFSFSTLKIKICAERCQILTGEKHQFSR